MDFCKENIRDAWQKVNGFTEGKASHQTINGRCPNIVRHEQPLDSHQAGRTAKEGEAREIWEYP